MKKVIVCFLLLAACSKDRIEPTFCYDCIMQMSLSGTATKTIYTRIVRTPEGAKQFELDNTSTQGNARMVTYCSLKEK